MIHAVAIIFTEKVALLKISGKFILSKAICYDILFGTSHYRLQLYTLSQGE